ncbi:MAG: hypothetical protein MPJ50_18055 [Pirellulales bacterium]|nr:hypothetical protein [Pirellulales bacterium]
MHVDESLSLAGKTKLNKLPKRLSCYELDASKTGLQVLPDELTVECELRLDGCRKLAALPRNLQVGTLSLVGCTALTSLPEGLDVWFLDVSGCTQLTSFPRKATIAHGSLNVHSCTSLMSLPNYLTHLGTLDISGCPQIAELPPGLQISSWIEIADSGLRGLLKRMQGIGIRWRSVLIDETIAFAPHRLRATAVVKEKNAEKRRVMIERMGFDRFFKDAGAKQIHSDSDPGGQRELLRVPLQNDEDIVCLSVNCPSTGRHYLLRVPPKMRTCHQAAAWMAGFDDPKLYKPLKET